VLTFADSADNSAETALGGVMIVLVENKLDYARSFIL